MTLATSWVKPNESEKYGEVESIIQEKKKKSWKLPILREKT